MSTIFDSFQAIIETEVFRKVCDILQNIKIRNHWGNAIQSLLRVASQQFEANEYSSADKIFKLICELALTTPLMREMIMFAVYNAIVFQQKPFDRRTIIDDNDPSGNVIDIVKLNHDAIVKWIKEFTYIIDKKRIPNLIKELEKIGFERS
jgi:hypothetical protein